MSELDEFKESFVSIMRERMGECGRYLQKMTENPRDAESLDSLRRLAHTMKGSASVMQFPRMAELFAQLQKKCEDIQKGNGTAREEFFDRTRETLSTAQRSLDAIAEGKDEFEYRKSP